jgi:hypothetical protein
VLPRGIWKGLYDSASGDPWGAVRSMAIVSGLVTTAAGYFAGAVCHSSDNGTEAK